MEKISMYDLSICKQDKEKQAIICFNTLQKSYVVLKIITGNNEEVRLLLKEILIPGEQKIQFTTGNLQPGDYTIKLIVNNDTSIDIERLNFKIN